MSLWQFCDIIPFRPLSGLNIRVNAGQVRNKRKRKMQAEKEEKTLFSHNLSSFWDHKIIRSRLLEVKEFPIDSLKDKFISSWSQGKSINPFHKLKCIITCNKLHLCVLKKVNRKSLTLLQLLYKNNTGAFLSATFLLRQKRYSPAFNVESQFVSVVCITLSPTFVLDPSKMSLNTVWQRWGGPAQWKHFYPV